MLIVQVSLKKKFEALYYGSVMFTQEAIKH